MCCSVGSPLLVHEPAVAHGAYGAGDGRSCTCAGVLYHWCQLGSCLVVLAWLAGGPWRPASCAHGHSPFRALPIPLPPILRSTMPASWWTMACRYPCALPSAPVLITLFAPILSSSALIFINARFMVDHGFRYPFALTGVGQISSAALAWAAGRVGLAQLGPPPPRAVMVGALLPVAVASAASLFLGNYAYLGLSGGAQNGGVGWDGGGAVQRRAAEPGLDVN